MLGLVSENIFSLRKYFFSEEIHFSEDLHRGPLGLGVEEIVGAGAEEGGQRRAEGVGGVVGGVAWRRRRVVARGRGVRRRGRREVLALRTMVSQIYF